MLRAKAVGISQGVYQGAAKLSSSVSAEYGRDYNTLVKEVKKAIPTIADILPPEARIETDNGYTVTYTPYTEIAGHCLQIIEMLQNELRNH